MTVANGIHTGLVRVVVNLDAINATLNAYPARQHRRPNIKLGNMRSYLGIERARTLLIDHLEIDTVYPWLRNYHQIDESCSSQLYDPTIELDFYALCEGPCDILADVVPNYPPLSSVYRTVSRYGPDAVLRIPTLLVLRITRSKYGVNKELYRQCKERGLQSLHRRVNELVIWICQNKLEDVQSIVP
ncbi:hypothetical protein EG328_011765 [Venturia inaequalis]|uniref:Uncharacterized protein n=1 Tax=Venturia inaequalis TaxID=5025 RepID=A0A8H3V616_VENIN|nr:hypothetical protein EG327_007472 [Venturia inaequalis]KAE9981303.1 hypothetical protein EG328_011765 [Venturia inaequalis]